MKGRGYTKVSWNELKDYPGETARVYGEPLAIRNFAFSINRQLPGGQGVIHNHAFAEEVYVVLRGRGVVIVNDQEIAMQPMDALRVEPGAMHTTKNASDEDVYWLTFGAPIAGFVDSVAVASRSPQVD